MGVGAERASQILRNSSKKKRLIFAVNNKRAYFWKKRQGVSNIGG
jgi:hypothetical protein